MRRSLLDSIPFGILLWIVAACLLSFLLTACSTSTNGEDRLAEMLNIGSRP